MEVTDREVLASVSIIAVMILIGFLISGKISDGIMDDNEVYYSWDTENAESLHANEIKFCGSTFPYKKIDLPHSKYIKTIPGDKVYSWESGERVKVRFVYYGVKTKYKGTIFADLRNGTIPNKTHFYKDRSLDDTVKMFETNATVAMVMFWIMWIILTGAVVYGFYYLDNEWLE